jgi:hypothetical protein
VANEPTFNELASQVYYMIKDCDLAGFNSDRFDIPLLAEELLRAGVDFDMKNSVSVDVQTSFIKEANIRSCFKILLWAKFRKCAFSRKRYYGNL